MALVVEDGTGTNANANSYGDLTFIKAYLDFRATPYPDDDDALTALAIQAMDFIEAYEPRFKGNRAVPLTQQLSWPRSCVRLYGNPMPPTNMPWQLKNAQAYVTGVAASGVDLAQVTTGRAIIKEVIGPIETDYSTTAGAALKPVMPQLDSILAPLLNVGVGIVSSVRV